MSKPKKYSINDALGGTTEQALPQDVVQAALGSAAVLGRAREVDIGRPATPITDAAQPVAKAKPAKKDGVKQTVVIDYDVWETMRDHIADQRRQGVRGYSGQQVITAALKQFLGIEQ